MLAVKALAGATAAAATAETVLAVIAQPDPMLFGLVSQPLFFAALAGASFGVFLMQDATTKNHAPYGDTPSGRWLGLLLKMGSLSLAVLGYALVSAALVTVVLDYTAPLFQASPGWIAASLVLGFFIRPLLPKLQGAWERVIDTTVDAYERVIGGGR